MAPLNIIFANWSFIHAPNVTAGVQQFVAERNLVGGYISKHAHEILEWISQPRTLPWSTPSRIIRERSRFSNAISDIVILITVWWITFTITITLVLCLGFGPYGVVAGEQKTLLVPKYQTDDLRGSLAAAFQAWAYGAFTPAGGMFATLTSLGMVGLLAPAVAIFGAGFATTVVSVVWCLMR